MGYLVDQLIAQNKAEKDVANNPTTEATQELLDGKKKETDESKKLKKPSKATLSGEQTTSTLKGASKGANSADNTRVVIPREDISYDTVEVEDDLSKKTGVKYVKNSANSKSAPQDGMVGLVEKGDDKVDRGIDYTAGDGKLANLRNEIAGIPEAPTQKSNERRDSLLGRYNFNLQHGMFTPFFQENWRKNAEIENKARISLIKSQGIKDARAAAANERVMQMRRNSIKSSWDKTIAQLDKGHYDQNGDGTLDEEAVYADLKRLAESYKRAGGDPDELTGFGLNRGGFAARTQKAKDIANDFIDMHNIREQLRQDLKDGSYGSFERRSAYDSVINRIQRVIGNAGGVQADADKIRVQYLYLPEWKMKEFKTNYQAYQNAMKKVTDIGGSSEARAQINERLNEGLSSLNVLWDKGANVQTKAQALFKAANALFNSNWQGLTSFGEAARAVQEQWDAYVKNIVLEAIIDPRILDYQLQLAEKQAKSRYENMVAQGGGRSLKMANDYNIPIDYSEYDKRPKEEYYIPFGSFDPRRLIRREGQEFVTTNKGSKLGGTN